MLSWRELYKPLILCVDENEDTLDLIRAELERQGYRVLTTNDSYTALQAFAACPIDAIVVGEEMPGMQGGKLAHDLARIKPMVPKLAVGELSMLRVYFGTPSSLTKIA